MSIKGMSTPMGNAGLLVLFAAIGVCKPVIIADGPRQQRFGQVISGQGAIMTRQVTS